VGAGVSRGGRLARAGVSRGRRLARAGERVAFVTLCLLLVYWAAAWPLQRRLLFPRAGLRAPDPPTVSFPGLQRLWLDTEAGRVEAWYMPGAGRSAAQPGPAVIFAHGNGEVIDDWATPLRPYVWRGVGVLLPEYRGYGRSAGRPSQAALTDDFVRFYDLLAARPEVDSRRVVLHGRSLGGGVVAALAQRRRPAALVLTSTFTSVPAMARRFLLPRFLVRDPFDTLAFLRQHEGPVLIMHGRHDTLIPYRHAVALAAAAPHARLVSVDAGHNDFPVQSPRVWREIFALLEGAGIVAPGAPPGMDAPGPAAPGTAPPPGSAPTSAPPSVPGTPPASAPALRR
jgi:fermentation-respiration switch protein FrsA (DUF1100 family)